MVTITATGMGTMMDIMEVVIIRIMATMVIMVTEVTEAAAHIPPREKTTGIAHQLQLTERVHIWQ